MKRIALVLLVFALHHGIAHAAAFCVSTSSQLETALAIAANNGEDDQIELSWGTYTSSGDAFVYSSNESHSLSLVGGFIDLLGGGPCSTHVRGANFTRLDGAGGKAVLLAYFSGASGDLVLSDLSLQNGVAVGAYDSPIYVGGAAGWNGNISIGRTVIRGNSCSATPVFIGTHGGEITIANSVFEDNQYLEDPITFGRAVAIHSDAASGDGVFLINDTFAYNRAIADPASMLPAIELSGTGYCKVVNSVFWNGGGQELALGCNGPNATGLWNDDIGAFFGTFTTSNNVFAKDPRFVSTTDLRPGGGSPLVDAGTNAFGLTNYDVLGQPRVVFGTVDIGAYEQPDRIFRNGFE